MGDGSTINVAIYGRVSTEHEEQMSAMENQCAWYETIAQNHSEWNIVERYYDKGITGTAMQKRPAFMKMLNDAKLRKFKLIITREVCRFARNTVDTLSVTRELKRVGVGVYFIQDGINTLDNDGELRLSIMATLAQDESRKISERVLAGQKISRQKGVLYGNGNILGYRRENGTYVIEPEQAYTVRKIFELYASGLGYKKICAELIRLGCKNAHGEVSWKVDRIGRILRNATYKGYIGYNKSHSDGYLTQKRVNHKEEEFQYVKGEFEAIVPESLWNQCAEIRNQKSASRIDANGRMQKFGSQEPQGVWKQKLRCSCGSSFRKYLWHKNANGTKTYGYECYRQKRNVSAAFLKRNHLDVKNVCQTKSIPAWQLDLMAKKVFSYVWKDQKDAVLLACKMLEECSRQEKNSENAVADSILKRMGMLEKKLEGLREMRALGDITREAFLIDKQKVEEECKKLEIQLHDLEQTEQGKKNNELDINAIRQTLNRWIDTSTLTISEELVDEFVLQIVVVDDQTFNWTLDLTAPNQTRAKRMKPSEIALLQYREKQTGCDSQLDSRITDPQMLLSFSITEAEAEEYCHAIGMKFFRKKWEDKTVIISI